MSPTVTVARKLGRAGIVIVTLAVAVAVNLLVYGAGVAAGGTYRFTSATGPAQVDALTITGFTLVPLMIGMTAVAILSRWWRWVIPTALVIAPLAAVGSIPFMPFAVDLDIASTVALAVAHVVVGAVAVVATLALRTLPPAPDAKVAEASAT